LSPAERAAFKKATAKVWTVRAKKASDLGKKLIEAMKK
jgi:TRAP-type C4-dicarboxylate transport system substrate-binding protein